MYEFIISSVDLPAMFDFIDKILSSFESCFSEKAAFRWFVCAITVLAFFGGGKLYQELRFVLVKYNGTQSILVGTSLELNPLSIIRLYSYHFRIECTFWELKQQTRAFCYHFCSKHMPRLDYYQKNGTVSTGIWMQMSL